MYSYLLPASKASAPDLSVPAQPVAAAPPQRRLFDQLHEQLRYLHYSLRTEEAYVHWVRAFVRWSGMRHPRLPVVLSVAEVRAVLGQLLYGTGMRITEALQLRTKDVDFKRGEIVVREGKAGKDRVVMLPSLLAQALKAQLRRAHGLWLADARAGRGGVQMPDALERKYPRAGSSWGSFWAFPQASLSVDPRSGVERRHHLHDQTFQRDFKRAVQAAGIARPATPHTLRHAFATLLLQA